MEAGLNSDPGNDSFSDKIRDAKAAFTRIQISGYLDIRMSEIRISSGRLHVSDRNVFGVYTCPDIRMYYTRQYSLSVGEIRKCFLLVKLHAFKLSFIFFLSFC